jgi:NADH-quinone oxidoreductase subunit M
LLGYWGEAIFPPQLKSKEIFDTEKIMITVLLLFFPLLAALLMLVLKGDAAKRSALALALVELGIFGYAFSKFKSGGAADLAFSSNWINGIGASFSVAMDGISLLMVLLTCVAFPLIILTSFNKNYSNGFYALAFVMQTALIGVFTATDGLLFYVFWELALLPIYFICLYWGGENRNKITLKFFIYTMVGSLLMLIGLIYLYQNTHSHTFAIDDLYEAGVNLSLNQQTWVFAAFFAAFAIKMPIFPLHTWQPDTYTVAPTQGTMLLSGIMLKMGTYGAIRWLIPMVPMAWQQWSWLVMTLAIVGIIYGSMIAIVQKDFKRLLAYSSFAHVGLIAAGIFAWNAEGLQGALMQMVAHGINVIGLFYIADIIASRTNTREILSLGGIRSVAPQLAFYFLIIMMGAVALPFTNGFPGEFLLINGVYQFNFWFAVAAGLTIILGAVYMLRAYQNMMLGETNALTEKFTDLDGNEKLVLAIIAVLVVVLGVYPKMLLQISEQDVNALIGLVRK